MTGADLRAYRQRRNLTQAQLAKETGLKRTTVRLIEAGQTPTEQELMVLRLVGVREDEGWQEVSA